MSTAVKAPVIDQKERQQPGYRSFRNSNSTTGNRRGTMPIVMVAALSLGGAGLAACVEPGTLLEGLWQMNLNPARAGSTTLG
jgi:hypothetical protein